MMCGEGGLKKRFRISLRCDARSDDGRIREIGQKNSKTRLFM